MLVSKIDIEKLIPQREPMVMVDGLLVSDDKTTVSTLNIEEENIFCENGVFTESGIIENIAQTAAARVGYQCLQEQKPVPLGFIGGVKNFRLYQNPKVNSKIQTTVRIVHEVMNATIINGIVMENDKLAAECELKIFLNEKMI